MPSKIKVAHILVKKHSEALAMIDKLKKGENFSKIAREHSICPSSKRGGNLGKISINKVVRPFWIAASKLKEGETTNEPIKTNFGYHIIKRTS